MRISCEWLADYVAVPDADALARKLTEAGLEVEGIDRPAAALEGVVVAQVVKAEPHPNAERLQVTSVDHGGNSPAQVVCGAKNFKVGDKVPMATVGASLPTGGQIAEATLRGVKSFGMLCSAKELGLSEDASGLMILDPSLTPGTPIAEALKLEDVIFELNVTPNRPDALCHLGVAREAALLEGAPFRLPEAKPKEAAPKASERVKIRIEDPKRCVRYAARVVEGVKVGPSPEWMAQRLKACGVRSINNVVDVTNYVLLETGQPLHAFDLDRLAGPEIVVRTAHPGESITTLDGKVRALDPDDLLICDRDRPQVIAGVMGGADSEVSEKTTRVLLECACFQPSTVRRSSKRHGLHTESSHRFERGTDVGAPPWVLDRAAQLLVELSPGAQVREGRIDVYPEPVPPREVTLRWSKVEAVLGVAIPSEICRKILGGLGFGLRVDSDEVLKAQVPSWRVDVEREVDLLEEIARIHGYQHIPLALPSSAAAPKEISAAAFVETRTREALACSGFDEVVSYSFVSPRLAPHLALRPLAELGSPCEEIALLNPISTEQSVMRVSLFPGLLESVTRNLRHQVEGVRLYELGRVYLPDPNGGRDGRPVAFERPSVAGVVWGRRGRTWTNSGTSAQDAPLDFFDAKGAVESLLDALHVRGASFVPDAWAPFHPRACAKVTVGDAVLGWVGELHPRSAVALDLPRGIFLFQLDLSALEQVAVRVPSYQGISRYPAVLRDLAVVVDGALRTEEVRKVILEVGVPLVEEASVFDVYTGEPIPSGKKNLAYALRYRATDRTLTDTEVNAAHARIVEEVNRRLGGTLRS